jgi:hypothetical protein
MQKKTIYLLFSLTFYFRLLILCYVLYSANIDRIVLKSIILKTIIMNSFTYCYIFYILLSKNLYQLRLYKIILLMNMFAIYFLFTYLKIAYSIICIYNCLIFADIIIEMHSIQTFYLEFMKHYVKNVGLSFKSYQNYVLRQKAKICIYIYLLSFLVDLFFDFRREEISKIGMILVLYFSFFRNYLHKYVLTLAILANIIYKSILFHSNIDTNIIYNAAIVFKMFFEDRCNISDHLSRIRRQNQKDNFIFGLLSYSHEFMLLVFIMYYSDGIVD